MKYDHAWTAVVLAKSERAERRNMPSDYGLASSSQTVQGGVNRGGRFIIRDCPGADDDEGK